MEVFSFSRLTKFENCPCSLYCKYVLGIEEETGEPAVFGKASHSAIETALVLNRNDEEFFNAISKAVADVAPVKIDPEEVFKVTFQDIVLEHFKPGNVIEDHFQIPLSDEPFSPKIQGYIDLWRDEGDHILLNDWKTNRKSYDPLENHQLALYAWYLNRQYKKPVKGQLAFLRHRQNTEPHIFTPEEMETARKWAFDKATEILNKLVRCKNSDYTKWFPATPGEHCEYCGYAFRCLGYGPLPDPEEGQDYQQMQAFARETLRVEAALKQMKDRIKEYVQLCGSVELDKKQYVVEKPAYWKWDKNSLSHAFSKMLQEGRNPFELISLNATNLKKLPWTQRDIHNLGAFERNASPRLKLLSKQTK